MIPFVSIAIPTYGEAPYLRECLNSVLSQSVTIEAVVCVGGSETSIPKNDYPGVKFLNVVEDPGMVSCWSLAADAASGKYLTFLADDNTLVTNFAEKLSSFLEMHPQCDFVFANQFAIDSSGIVNEVLSRSMTERYGRSSLRSGPLQPSTISQIMNRNAIPLEAMMIRRSVWKSFGPFDSNALGAFDLHFILKLLAAGLRGAYVGEYLMNFRWHEESYSSRRKLEHAQGSLWAIKNIIQHYPKYEAPLLGLKELAMYTQLFGDIPKADRKLFIKLLMRTRSGRLKLLRYGGRRILQASLRLGRG